MAGRQARPRLRPFAPLLDENDTQFWGSDYPPVAVSLLTSAVACFAKRGFDATTTRDIGIGAGLSTAALYVHFSSKEDLLFTIMSIGHERALDALMPAALLDGDDGDPVVALSDLVKRFVTWHTHHTAVGRICQYEVSALTPERYGQITVMRNRITDVFRHAVTRGIAAGVFDADDVNQVVRVIIYTAIDVVRWYRADGPLSSEDLADLYANLALRMLGAAQPALRELNRDPAHLGRRR